VKANGDIAKTSNHIISLLAVSASLSNQRANIYQFMDLV
jgi:hypothetical protein